jgi:hypothetical protein
MNGYGPNVEIPTEVEADRDIHEHADCSYSNLCAACRRQLRRNR